MQPKNNYRILGVTEKATSDEIRRAFRELAKKLHPDKNPGNKKSEEAFKEVQEAYSTLSDPVKRSKYGLKLKYGEARTSRQSQNTSSSNTQQRKTYNSYTYRARSHSQGNVSVNPVSVMVTFSAVVVFIYFAATHFGDIFGTKEQAVPVIQSNASAIPKAVQEKIQEISPINNADSPYDPVFGPIVYDTSSHNSIYLYNSGFCEAIVCIAEAKAPFKIIRNEYIGKGVKFKLDGIPDGVYYAKVYYGNKWNSSKKIGRATGGFNEELGFVSYNNKNMLFDMRQKHAGHVISFSSYQLTLDPRDTTSSIMLTAEQFFH